MGVRVKGVDQYTAWLVLWSTSPLLLITSDVLINRDMN